MEETDPLAPPEPDDGATMTVTKEVLGPEQTESFLGDAERATITEDGEEADAEEAEETPAEAERKQRALSGRYVVMYSPGPQGPFFLLGEDVPGEGLEPYLYEAGNQDEARRAALEDKRVPGFVKQALEGDRKSEPLFVAAMPAASWRPAPARQRIVQSSWVFGA